jgi:repressor LexA
MFPQNLKYLRNSRGMDQAKFAKAVGKSVSTVSEWESGKYTPKAGVLADIAALFDVKLDDLMSSDLSEPRMFIAPKQTAIDNALDSIPGIHSYPYIPADISAGTPERVDAITPDQLEQVAVPDAVMGKWAGHTDISLMRANGESMNRVIPNGSLIGVRHIEETSELNDGDIVVFDCDGEYAVKRFFNDRAHQQYIFQPDSDVTTFYPITHSYDDEELVDIVGKVVMYVVELD